MTLAALSGPLHTVMQGLRVGSLPDDLAMVLCSYSLDRNGWRFLLSQPMALTYRRDMHGIVTQKSKALFTGCRFFVRSAGSLRCSGWYTRCPDLKVV